jgi:hypothetical protein
MLTEELGIVAAICCHQGIISRLTIPDTGNCLTEERAVYWVRGYHSRDCEECCILQCDAV